MSFVKAGRFIAAAGSGVAAGAAGMFLYDRSGSLTGEGTTEVSHVKPDPKPADVSPSPVASEFMMPFVERYGLPDLDQIILPSYEYTSCWDSRTRNARWVVERINLATITGKGDRKRASFKADSRLQPLFRSELSDYKGSGLDRGHLAPAGDHKTTEEHLKETFLLTNMSPQPSFNRGYWADFEEWVRLLVIPTEKKGKNSAASTSHIGPFKDVYVITGPLYLPSLQKSSSPTSAGHGGAVDANTDGVVEVTSSSSSPSSVGKYVVKYDIIGNPMRMVAVPTHFFKVVIAEPFREDASKSSPAHTYVAAFAMPNVQIPNNTDLRNFLVPLEALESVAGMRFLGAASFVGGGLDAAAREFLDKQAVAMRAAARVPALSEGWVNCSDNRYLKLGTGEDDARVAERRLFRHLCSVTSCVGV